MMMEGFSPYGPSKAALEAATVVWAKDLAGTGVTVNALAPGGPANTRMIPATEVADRSTLIQPEVMIAPIVWLMSPRSDGVTGRRIIAKEWDAARLRANLRRKSEHRRDGEEKERWIRATCTTKGLKLRREMFGRDAVEQRMTGSARSASRCRT
jgi:Dehydrogenases with different specificities (related to short-chain alcohol dehydrogenases)